jgi:hypothetical protein
MGVTLDVDVDGSLPAVHGNRRLIARLISILVERVCNMDAEERCIRIRAHSPARGQVQLSLTADSLPWENGKVASLYSALIPFREWPMGVDMDILSAFFIAHHHGGEVRLVNEAAVGPGFLVRLACEPGPDQDLDIGRTWFDRVFRSVELWRSAPLP